MGHSRLASSHIKLSLTQHDNIQQFALLCGTLSIPLNPPWNQKRSILWLPPFEGGREGDLKGDFDLLYFITAQSAVRSPPPQISLVRTTAESLTCGEKSHATKGGKKHIIFRKSVGCVSVA